MQRFTNILFVNGPANNTAPALQRAVKLARTNEARLTIKARKKLIDDGKDRVDDGERNVERGNVLISRGREQMARSEQEFAKKHPDRYRDMIGT